MPGNWQWRLLAKPAGLVERHQLEYISLPVREPGPGEVLMKHLYISLDPGQQFFMSATDEAAGPMRVGDVVRAWAVGRVIASNSGQFPIGSYARDRYGFAGMQEYSVLPAASLVPLDPDFAPLSAQINALGMPGLTAYLGLIDIGRPQPGETVVVSGAGGAVGSTVGQLAKASGCRAVGISGGAEKCRYVVEQLGFDDCVDYRADGFSGALKRSCPRGIDVYFDNVAGVVLETCLEEMAFRGRIVSCGAIAEYGNAGPWRGLHNYYKLLFRSLRWEGLSIHNYYDRYDETFAALEACYRAGKLHSREEVAVGLENFLPVFYRLFNGTNRGKLVLQVHAGETR